jgi:hypothetical protein
MSLRSAIAAGLLVLLRMATPALCGAQVRRDQR